MKRHAKASSAESTAATGTSRGALRRALSTRASSSDATGIGAPSVRSFALAPPALITATLAAATYLLLAGSVPRAAADICPNEAFRTGPSAYLPDCRAYEQVSPAAKNGSDILNIAGNEAAPTGDRIAYGSVNALPDTKGIGFVSHLRSIRGPNGWATRDISPPLPANDLFQPPGIFNINELVALSPDLSKAVWHAPADPPTLAGTQPFAQNFYYQSDVPDGPYQLINPPWPSVGGSPVINLGGASADLSHLLLTVQSEETPLLPGDPALSGNENGLYEWDGNELRLATILPDGTPTGAASPGLVPGEMSADGSRIFFVANNPGLGTASLYVRINGAQTLFLANLGSGTGSFLGATPDGSRAFYRDQTGDLFAAEVGSGQSIDIGSADSLAGFSDDGSHVYFQNNAGDLKVWDNGVVSEIAPNLENTGVEFDVSPSGRYLSFTTKRQITAYDNAGFSEVYRYDAENSTLNCVSCSDSGAPPVGGARLTSTIGFFENQFPHSEIYHVRNVLDDGRVYFESPDALVSTDVNGEGGCPVANNFNTPIQKCQDVYEWKGGRAQLISSGQDDAPSTFSDVSPSGDDVFFITRQQLSRADVDRNADLYDARVGGGYPTPEPSQSCSGDACRGKPSAPPSDPTPGSSSFVGQGNQRKGHGPATSPTKKSKKKCKKHGHHKCRNARRANTTRRAGK